MRLLSFVILALSFSDLAYAYRYMTCHGAGPIRWPSRSESFHANTSSFPLDPGHPDAERTAALQEVVAQINSTPGVPVSLQLLYGNGTDDVYFTDDMPWGTLGYTEFDYYCLPYVETFLREADIKFNANYEWRYGPYSEFSDFRGGKINFELVALHEFGHAVGLKHETRSGTNMNPFYPFHGPLGETHTALHSDDAAGWRRLYGTHTHENDFYVSNYRREDLGRLVSLPFVPVLTGDVVNVEYSVGSRGTTDQWVFLDMYLSQDKIIDVGVDPLVHSTTWFMPVNSFGTHSLNILIPPGIPSGDYHYLIDFSNNEEDKFPENNIVPLHRKLRVFEQGTELPPYNLTASNGQSASSITLNWVNGANYDRVYVYRRTDPTGLDPGCLSGDLIATLENGFSNSYVDDDSSLVLDYHYAYSVMGENFQGVTSPCSDVDLGFASLIPPPSNVTASNDNRYFIEINWDLVPGATGYNVYRVGGQTATCQLHGHETPWIRVQSGFVTFARDFPSVNIPWKYAVTTLNQDGESVLSECAVGSITGVPAPFSIVASDRLKDRIEVNWSYVNGSTGYRLYRSLFEQRCVGTPIVEFSNSWDVSYTDVVDYAPLAHNVDYYYSVAALDQDGLEGPCSPLERGRASDRDFILPE